MLGRKIHTPPLPSIRFGVFLDPYGQTWAVSNTSTPLHDVPKELARKVIPFVSVRDAAGYITFLTEVFGAETVYPPAKDPTGKVSVQASVTE